MSIEELISSIQKYPPYFEVKCIYDKGRDYILEAEIEGVEPPGNCKTVNLKLATRLLCEGKET
jgi:hypothetical protein